MNEEEKVSVACLKMPTEHMDFVKGNPRLAKVIGTSIVSLMEIYSKIEVLKDMIKDKNFIAPLLDKGTPEEAVKFIEAAIEASTTSFVNLKDVSREALEQIKERLGSNLVETRL